MSAQTTQAHSFIAALPDLADQLAAQLHELHRDPEPDRCDRMRIALAGAQEHVRRLACELLRGDPPTV